MIMSNETERTLHELKLPQYQKRLRGFSLAAGENPG